ncbi:PAS-domain containing protein [Desertibaculum subflavum]|uniref:PAS-domain containing protein n=1 Tax=Desertibaculum subflavum TaxID=2268458 RepID=UPI0013C4546B
MDASAEDRLRDFADAAFEWFWEQDADLRFTYFSSNVEAASGFPAGDFLGKTRGETRPLGVSPEAWSRHLDDLLNHRPFRDFRFARQDSEGRTRWFFTGGKPIHDAEGRFAGYRGVGREITAEVEAEARARAAEVRLTDAIESLSDGFVLFDKDDRLVKFNNSLPGFAATFGDGAIGRTYRELLTDILQRGLILRPPEFATDQGWIDYVLALRAPGFADYEVQTRRGRWFACRDRRTSDGGTVGIRVDITETKRREQELAAREARAVAAEHRLRDAIDALADGFILYDAEDRVVIGNEALIRQSPIYGSTEAIVGQTYDDLMRKAAASGYFADPAAQADPAGWVTRLRERRKSSSRRTEGAQIETSDGRIFQYRVHPTREGGLVGIRTDVTDMRRREAELARREARAVAAEQRLRDAIEAMADTFVLYDADDRVVVCNQRYVDQIGFGSVEEVQGRTYAENMRRLLARGFFDDPLAKADPEKWIADRLTARWHDDFGRDITLADGRINRVRTQRTRDGGLVSIMSDVTEDRAREARAVAAELRLREAIESMSDGFSLWGPDDRLILSNSRHLEIFGLAEAELTGKTWTEVARVLHQRGFYDAAITPFDVESWRDRQKAGVTAGLHDREVKLRDGRTLHVRARRMPDGMLLQVTSDITRDRDRETRARRAEEQLRDAIESLSDAFILRDGDDRPVMYNRRYLDLLGFDDPAALAQMTSEEVRRHLLARKFFAEPMALQDPEAWLAERRAHRLGAAGEAEAVDSRLADGRVLNVRTRRTAGGAMVTILSDVTADRERETRALRAEAQLRDAIESLSDGFILRDAKDLPVMCNRRYLQMFGFAAEDLAGKTSDDVRRLLFLRGFFADPILDTNPEQWFSGWLAPKKGPDAVDVRLADGRILNIRTRATEAGGMVTIFADVTAERERDRREREAELLLRTAIDSIDDSFSLWDRNDRLLLWNQPFERRLSATGSGPIRGITYRDFILLRAQEGAVDTGGLQPSDYAETAAQRHRRLETREAIYRDGSTILVRERALPDGGIVRLDTDITERKRQERLVHEAEQQLRTAIETLDDGFSLWDAQDRLLLWNRPLEELFSVTGVPVMRGMPFREWVERHVRSGKVDTGKLSADEFIAQRNQAHRAFGVREITFTDGRTLLVREQRLPEGGTVRLDIDITARKHQETQLVDAKEAAEQASRAKSTFLATMSHELRTPLNAILGFSETMAKEMLGPLGTPRYLDYAADIHSSGMLLLDLINDMLDMSRIEAGRYELRRETVKPDDLAHEAIGVIGVQADKAGVALGAEIEAGMPRVALDRRAVRQVLLNLLSNAIKFSKAGDTVTLSAGVVEGMLRYRIADQGIGIAKQDIGRLARPFERAGNVMTQPIQGTGLGLSISKRLIELHGGKLEIESELNRGTTVTVLLPIIGA